MAPEPVKKRKKNAPDKPQPAWLFPPEEENPVLNPKPVSEEQQQKADIERQQAIDFLTRRAYGVPEKPAPDPQLLNLIAIFLTEYGFHSTCRTFTTERVARKKLNGWEDNLGGKVKPGTPRLAKIYKDWLKEWEERRQLDMTSSEEDDDPAKKREKMMHRRDNPKPAKAKVEDEQTSSSGSDDSSDDEGGADVEMKDAPPTKTAKQAKRTSSGSPSSSSQSTSSESDADDEKETATAEVRSQRPTVNNLVNKLKRKAADSEATSESPDRVVNGEKSTAPKKAKLESSTDKTKTDKKVSTDKKVKTAKDDKQAKAEVTTDKSKRLQADDRKKTKKDKKASAETAPNPKVKAPVTAASSSEVSSSSSPSSEESKAEPAPSKKTKKAKTEESSPPRKTSTDSSATLEHSETKQAPAVPSGSSASSSSSSSSDTDSTPPPKKSITTTKKKSKSKTKSKDDPAPSTNGEKADSEKPPKKKNAPFSRIPQDTQVDPRMASNAYVPYDYAERAHQDLIVTKGKGFTKEKNKKKRGSYRGGAIDVDGRKGIKFDD